MPQLCIPRIDATINKDYIFKTLCKLKWGKITKIVEIPLRDDNSQKRILININWNGASNIKDIRTNLSNGRYINIVHDSISPWFWRITMSKSYESKK
jgi:hypothetical protein